MLNQNRHSRRRVESLRAQGFADDEIAEAPDRAGDPLFDARKTQDYCGGISPMTLWRWTRKLGFPQPDIIIQRRKFWRKSTLDTWIEARIAEQQAAPMVNRPPGSCDLPRKAAG